MDKVYFENFLNDKFNKFIILPNGEKIKPYEYHVKEISFTRFATPEKCNRFGLTCDEVSGGFISGSMGELGGKFLYRQIHLSSDDKTIPFDERIDFTYLPEEDDFGIPVAKVNFIRKINSKYAEHLANLVGKDSEEYSILTKDMSGYTFVKIKLEI